MSRFTEISVSSTQREQLVDITSEVNRIVMDTGTKDGAVLVFCPHTTGGITINENADPDVKRDVLKHLREMVPRDHGFRHMEGNSDSHIKSSMTGSSCLVPLSEGRMLLGTWQGIYFAEFDGPRRRRVTVGVI